MKNKLINLLALAALCVLPTGCYTYGTFYPTANPSNQAVLNNTGWTLDVYQDGVIIGKNVPIGAIVPVRPTLWQRQTTVTVTGYSASGVYMGANTFTFNSCASETWAVNKLEIPPHYQ